MKTTILVALIIFLLSSAVNSQNKINSLTLSLGPGYTISNHPDFPEVNETAFVTSLIARGRLDGSKPWHKYYYFPFVGFNLSSASLGNKNVLGYYVGLMTDLTFKSNQDKKSYLEYTVGMGAAWFSKPYNEISNPENVVVGSSFTFSVNASIAFNRHISERSTLQLKAYLIHCSNSHFQLPNVGLNLPSLQLGYRYQWRADKLAEYDTTNLVYDKRWRPTIRIAFGINEQGSSVGPVNGPKYPIYLGAVYVSKKLSPISKFFTGVEYYFNTGFKDYILSQNFYDEKINKRSSVISLTFGHEFLFGHLGLVTTLGINIYNKFHQDRVREEEIEGFKEKLKTYIPARLGFQYYLKDATRFHGKNMFLGLYIKSNFGQADFLESSIGYTF